MMQMKMLMVMDYQIFASTGGAKLLMTSSEKGCHPMERPTSQPSHGCPPIPTILIPMEILFLMDGRRDIPALGIRTTRELIH